MAVRENRELFPDAVRFGAEIHGMLGLRLPIELADRAAVASALDAAMGADRSRDSVATRELVAMLSTDRTTRGFVDDLAEILFLPRHERSEYHNNRLASAPWVISKLLLEYATHSWRLDRLTGLLMKDLCASNCCGRLPVGCCSVLGYDLGLVPEAMLAAQEVEARRSGWVAPAREAKCRYHGERGCVIGLFKSPACIGYVCEPLWRQLSSRYPSEELAALRESLARFRNADLDRSTIFELMDAAIRAGAELGD